MSYDGWYPQARWRFAMPSAGISGASAADVFPEATAPSGSETP